MVLSVVRRDTFRLFLVLLFFLGLLVSNFIFELEGVLSYSHHLLLRSVLALAVVSLFFSMRRVTRQKLQPVIRVGIIVLAAALFINIFLNMINVYSLGESFWGVEFCAAFVSLCTFVQTVFFTFKLFRFITLSSYFFLLPLFTLLMIYLGNDFVLGTKKYDLPRKFFLALIFLLILPNLLKSFHRAYLSIIQSYQIRHENFYDRFVFKEGGPGYYGWIKVFSNFILAQTPTSASLLVPPQAIGFYILGDCIIYRVLRRDWKVTSWIMLSFLGVNVSQNSVCGQILRLIRIQSSA